MIPGALPGRAVDVLLEDVVVSYRTGFRRQEVLRSVTMSAQPGEITAIVGPNGAGKSTLFCVVLGLLRPDRGRCRVAGLRPADYRRLYGTGYLPELSGFPGGWTVRGLLARGADLSALDDPAEVLETAIDRAGFDAATLSKQIKKCSKGVQRMLGLAYALAGDPALVVLDEPFSGLDVHARAALRREMLAARGRGSTVLFASHEIPEIERLADRAFILQDGIARPASAWCGDSPAGPGLEAELTAP